MLLGFPASKVLASQQLEVWSKLRIFFGEVTLNDEIVLLSITSSVNVGF